MHVTNHHEQLHRQPAHQIWSPCAKKIQHYPYNHTPIQCDAKIQYTKETPDISCLDEAGILHVQSIVGALLYYSQAMDIKLIVALRKIGHQQASSTEATNKAIEQLLDYVTTYPNDGITYRAGDMVLVSHSNVDHLNARNVCSRNGLHIMISKDVQVTNINGPVLIVSQIIKFVISSSAKSELA